MGLLGNMYLQQEVIFEAYPQSELTQFAEKVSNTLSDPRIKSWVKKSTPQNPNITYAILNICKQAYLLALGQTRKRAQVSLMAAGEHDSVSEDPYKQIEELANTLAVRLESASKGGEKFADCTL